MLREFLSATTTGDVDRLAQVLAGDATLISDGANLGAVAPPPVQGAKAISHYLLNKARELLPPEIIIQRTSFKTVPLLLTYCEGKLKNALAFVLRDKRIHTIYRITCPVRLRSLSAQRPFQNGVENLDL